MVPPTLFFFVLLHAVLIIRALMVKGTGIPIQTSAAVLVASLILGKAVLIANMLPFINWYPDHHPLIYNAAWKTLLYTIIAGILHFLERLFEFWKETHNLAAAYHELMTHINWPQFCGHPDSAFPDDRQLLHVLRIRTRVRPRCVTLVDTRPAHGYRATRVAGKLRHGRRAHGDAGDDDQHLDLAELAGTVQGHLASGDVSAIGVGTGGVDAGI